MVAKSFSRVTCWDFSHLPAGFLPEYECGKHNGLKLSVVEEFNPNQCFLSLAMVIGFTMDHGLIGAYHS